MKQRLIATGIISLSWIILDYLFHNVILMKAYIETAQLWRPMLEMNTMLMTAVTVGIALIFVIIYCGLIINKSMQSAIRLGLLIGLLMAVSSGIGPYVWMPITPMIASVWSIAHIVKFVTAGAIAGYFITTNA